MYNAVVQLHTYIQTSSMVEGICFSIGKNLQVCFFAFLDVLPNKV